ncbi:hypothetical protein JTE90_003829 [Oedothorax gibbosus]|uniref:Uncharacterized protein n=1 Tax=Oedothorax gibbosus TaxID=931172 RepID=A0AAV6VG85_9ARAC|nr:hypothetical protein JTE90_003829 [Oedothorax gibbosus]
MLTFPNNYANEHMKTRGMPWISPLCPVRPGKCTPYRGGYLGGTDGTPGVKRQKKLTLNYSIRNPDFLLSSKRIQRRIELFEEEQNAMSSRKTHDWHPSLNPRCHHHCRERSTLVHLTS